MAAILESILDRAINANLFSLNRERKTATASDFTFVCFYDNGKGWYRNFVPVYNVAGMEYRVEAGKIVVVG